MTTKEIVEKVLENNPKSRDDDRVLMLDVWEEEGLVLTDAQKEGFRHVSLSESITRHRRKLQEAGEYKASTDVARKRTELETETRSKIKSNPDGISWMK